jgi:hypothetical protein
VSRPDYLRLVDRAIAAYLAAIEIYNKPNFSYREEAFSILMLSRLNAESNTTVTGGASGRNPK